MIKSQERMKPDFKPQKNLPHKEIDFLLFTLFVFRIFYPFLFERMLVVFV